MIRVLIQKLTKIREGGILHWLKTKRENMEDKRLNRQLIGEDRFGNKYYQYYSYYGLPTRREVRFRSMENIELQDLVYYRWLYNHEFDPPSEAEKLIFYQEEQLRLEKARAWDRKQALLAEEFKNKRERLLQNDPQLWKIEQRMTSNQLGNLKTKRQEASKIDGPQSGLKYTLNKVQNVRIPPPSSLGEEKNPQSPQQQNDMRN